MYLYDDFDRTLVAERVDEFRDQVRAPAVRRADRGRVQAAAPDERPLPAAPRLHAADRHSLRHAVVRPAAQAGACRAALRPRLRPLHHAAEHPVQLDQAGGAARRHGRAGRVGMHGMQTSGNCVRNITTDQWAGVAADEIEDPRIWAEILRQSSTLHPEFSFLPRKFKIAITGVAARPRRGAGARHRPAPASQRRRRDRLRGDRRRRARPHAVHRQDHQAVPAASATCSSYVEAILRVYNQFGRRDNIYKARIKILVHELGAESVRQGGRGRMAARSRTARWRSIPRSSPRSPRASAIPTTSSSTTARRSWRKRARGRSRASPPGSAIRSPITRCPATPS